MVQARVLPVLFIALLLARGVAAASYDEESSGDISGDGRLPTQLVLGVGSNQVAGHYGRAARGGNDVA
ncbi:MAG: hypothetical protein K2Y51_12570 [Gammaproteobacteria bacterium]|nr:hypothetical protein [Gammaproteobacteria bacterium]